MLWVVVLNANIEMEFQRSLNITSFMWEMHTVVDALYELAIYQTV